MRILVISNFLPPRMIGGFELACYNISKGLRARGHEVLILTTPTEKEPPENQDFVDRVLTMRWFPKVPVTDPTLLRFLRRESLVSQQANTQIVLDRIRQFRPDHVLFFNLVGIGGLALVDMVDATGIPWTMNLGDRVPSALVEGIPRNVREIYNVHPEGDLFRRGWSSIVSQTLIDEIRREGISLGKNVQIIPRGVIVRDVKRTRPYRENGVTKFVSAGALLPHKGIDLVLEAAARLDAEGEFEFFIDIYGDGRRAVYEKMANDLGVSHRVAFHGSVSQREVIEANAGADSFLFPTWEREPGASAPIEAGVAGSVTIMTGNCGPAERLVHGVHCLKIERTVDSLVAAMRQVGKGEIDLETMGKAAQKLAAGDLSFDVSIQRLEKLLAREITEPRPNRVDDRTLDLEVLDKDERSVRALYELLERR